MLPMRSRGSPNKGTKSEAKTYAGGNNDAPSISKYGSLVRADAQIVAQRTLSAPPVGHGSKKMPGTVTLPQKHSNFYFFFNS